MTHDPVGKPATTSQTLLELRAILDNATVGILFTKNRLMMQGNKVFVEMFGYDSAEEIVGRPGSVLYPDEEAYAALGHEAGPVLAAGEPYRTEIEMRRKDGSTFRCRMSAKAINPQRPHDGTIWITEDVTERHTAEQALRCAHDELEQRVLERTSELSSANQQLQAEIFERLQAEQRIWHIAHHDCLTGLPNRTLLHDRLEQTLAQAGRAGSRVAVIFLDLDRFKAINDTLGHGVGDELLKHVAGRLSAVVRTVDTVSRLGGDEFVIVMAGITGPEDAAVVAQKIIDSLAAAVTIEGHALRATPSLGIALFPDDGATPLQLMKNADTAMYHAKARGRNTYEFFTERLNTETEQAFTLEQRLRHAIEAGHLVLHYQPLVDMVTRKVTSLEALLRWDDPERGIIAPADFIPLAEETGLILPIGAWVIAEALRQNRRWQEAGMPLLPVSVNLSPRQFRQKDLVDSIRSLLAETGQPAHLLELEITESTLLHDLDAALETLRELDAMGVRLAIDDFGTGYSSLNHLKRLPVHKLKIDQSFVRDLCHDRDDAAIVNAIVGLGRAMDLRVLAEGVETDGQLRALDQLGCRHYQGYLFSRPLPPDQVEQLFNPVALDSPGAESDYTI